jgi:hypothetical protein
MTNVPATGPERSSDYVFVMRCWTRDEPAASLSSHGRGCPETPDGPMTGIE